MRPLASLVLALCLLGPVRAADVAPDVPRGPVPLSAPVLSALSVQLGELAKMRAAPPTTIAIRLAGLARAQGTDAPTSSAASALLIKQALADSRALKTLFDSLQETGDRGVAASHALADLRESMYAGSTPEKIQATLQWSMGKLEDKLKAGQPLTFENLAAFYDGQAGKNAPDAVDAAAGPPGRGDKIVLPLQPSQEPRPALGAVPNWRRDSGVVLENENEASTAVLQALNDALGRVGALPPGVRMTVRNGRVWGDNPQILIDAGGRTVYHQYLYHAEADLGRARLGLNPVSWFGWLASRGAPSADLSRRFEAALRLARKAGER